MSNPDDITDVEALEPVVPRKEARYWVQCVEYQSRRVVTTFGAASDLRRTCQMEEHFLLTAVQKACRWLGRIPSDGLPEDARNLVMIFEKSVAHASGLRNLREHDDEYDTGAGRDRSQIHAIYSGNNDRLRVDHRINCLTRDHSPIGDLNDTDGLHVWLGGRFDVIPAMQAARELAACLVARENQESGSEPIPVTLVGPTFPSIAAQRGDEADDASHRR